MENQQRNIPHVFVSAFPSCVSSPLWSFHPPVWKYSKKRSRTRGMWDFIPHFHKVTWLRGCFLHLFFWLAHWADYQERLKLFTCQPTWVYRFQNSLASLLIFGTWVCYLEQNQTPNDIWSPAKTDGSGRQAYQTQPQVARVWLVAAGNFPPCSHVFQMLWIWIQLVTLLHVSPSLVSLSLCAEFFLSSFLSFFPRSLHHSTNRSTV